MTQWLWLFPVGLLLGAFGTLIGAGGGFLLVPLLLLAYPRESPEIVTSISLAVVFFNAASGSFAYARLERIDYRSAAILSLAAIPGAVLGAVTTSLAPRAMFDLIFGLVLLGLAAHLLLQPRDGSGTQEGLPARGSASLHRMPLAAALSVLAGYVSTFLGIGGGIVHVPLLVRVLRFPVHVATATSHLILALLALTGTLVHLTSGAFSHGWRRTILLGVGAAIGAQFGAHISRRVRGPAIIRALAIALAFVGVRILWSASMQDLHSRPPPDAATSKPSAPASALRPASAT